MVNPYIYMKRALDLAVLGKRFVAPNPMVGAVIVHNDRIIGEGYHHQYGQAHAEVMAVNAVKDKRLLKDSTIYVTLEPCAHYGKTPPCAELIIKVGIPRVVVAMQDPFSAVAGRGIAMLREAGVEVSVGLMEDEARQLNKHFLSQHQSGRPYIKLKWAESCDGFIDRLRENSNEATMVFSSSLRQRIVHRDRAYYQAILVGFRTALLDNPSLVNRYWSSRGIVRIILDRNLSLPKDYQVFTDDLAQTLICYDKSLVKDEALQSSHSSAVEYVAIDYNDLTNALIKLLQAKKINSLYVEGGSATHKLFIDNSCFDEIERELSTISLGSGIPSAMK